jgi:periplasmic protein TonB
MSAITVNAFPPLHTFNSSRSWFMALIVLLHAGFFWVLTHGVTIGTLKIEPPVLVDFIPDKQKPEVFPPQPPEPRGATQGVVDPVRPPPEVIYHERIDDGDGLRVDPGTEPTVGPGSAVPVPAIVPPQADPRFPFTEPDYPVPDIRMGHEGTVWLTIEILPNGRVGAVHIDKSSGFDRLDAAAVREAHKWRMQPGTQDGIAIPMYKRVPVTFRLKD